MAENCLKIVGVGAPTVVLKRNDWKLIQFTGRNTAGYKKTILERPDGQASPIRPHLQVFPMMLMLEFDFRL